MYSTTWVYEFFFSFIFLFFSFDAYWDRLYNIDNNIHKIDYIYIYELEMYTKLKSFNKEYTRIHNLD
jgi:hypothetical protein